MSNSSKMLNVKDCSYMDDRWLLIDCNAAATQKAKPPFMHKLVALYNERHTHSSPIQLS